MLSPGGFPLIGDLFLFIMYMARVCMRVARMSGSLKVSRIIIYKSWLKCLYLYESRTWRFFIFRNWLLIRLVIAYVAGSSGVRSFTIACGRRVTGPSSVYSRHGRLA